VKRSVIELKPTQFSLGMKEVEKKAHKLKHMSSKELDEYLEAHPVPVVVSPTQELYLVDHHHLARASWEAGVRKLVTKVQADLSHLNKDEFWKILVDSHWAYLYDQFGNGPHAPDKLPDDVRCLADDPYRSLAWAVREEGGYEKTHHPFAEFKWAAFFREKISFGHGEHEFRDALKRALDLCRSHHVVHLPGSKPKK
jgi:hypothetical protein